MFARLRKLQFFKAVESCTGGYGRFRCQRVKCVILNCSEKDDMEYVRIGRTIKRRIEHSIGPFEHQQQDIPE